MRSKDEYRDDEHDWPDETPGRASGGTEPETSEAEEGSADHTARRPARRRPAARKRGSYRPPSELDRD